MVFMIQGMIQGIIHRLMCLCFCCYLKVCLIFNWIETSLLWEFLHTKCLMKCQYSFQVLSYTHFFGNLIIFVVAIFWKSYDCYILRSRLTEWSFLYDGIVLCRLEPAFYKGVCDSQLIRVFGYTWQVTFYLFIYLGAQSFKSFN